MDLFCIAHRGASGHEPENTVLAVRRALELGADGIEVDVHNVKGELMVIHDDTLERTTDGRGTVAGNSVSRLRSLDAGKGERIPFLREIIEAVAGRALLNIELKGPHTALLTLEALAGYASRGWSSDRFLISSFDHVELRKAAGRGIPIAVLWRRPPRDWEGTATGLRAASVNVSLRSATPLLIKRAHALGLKVFAYTANTSVQIARMRSLGVDGVFTDFPERVKP